jgi:SsrA-binding protein
MTEDIAVNRKALHSFKILDRYEAGIELKGTEVKAIRDGLANIHNAFARIEGGQMFAFDIDIQPYSRAGYSHHESKCARRLLLHRQEIEKLAAQTQIKGHTLVVLRMYWKEARVKLELGLASGKEHRDQRSDLKAKAVEREMAREKASFNRRHL